MAETPTQAPAAPATPAPAATVAPAVRAPAAPAAPQPTLQLGHVVLTLVTGLAEVAEAEGSQAKPSAKAWGTLKAQLAIIMDELGIQTAPAPASSTRIKPATAQAGQRQMTMRTPYWQRSKVPPTRARVPAGSSVGVKK